MGHSLVGTALLLPPPPADDDDGVFFLSLLPFGLPGDFAGGVTLLGVALAFLDPPLVEGVLAFLAGDAGGGAAAFLGGEEACSGRPWQVEQWAISSLIRLKVRWQRGHSPPLEGVFLVATASLLALLFGVADGLPTFPLLGVFLTGRDSGSESDDELEEEVSSGLGDLLGGATRLVGLELFRLRLPVLRSLLEEELGLFLAGGDGVAAIDGVLGEAMMGLGSWITNESD